MNVAEHFELHTHPNIPKGSKNFFCGIECEIEDIKVKPNVEGLFMVEVDHSLRNSGLEYKTYPADKEETLNAFVTLHKAIKLGDNPFSERTSIHVHVNMSSLSLYEVKQFVLAYALLEPLFFEFVGEKRQNNIFCVPLFYTYLPSVYKKDIPGLHNVWHKYTAFNIKPLGHSDTGPGIGTIEFRHLFGTADSKILDTWLSVLEEFYLHFANNEVNVLQMLADGQTAEQLANLFIPTLVKAVNHPNINELCKETILDVKLATGGLTK